MKRSLSPSERTSKNCQKFQTHEKSNPTHTPPQTSNHTETHTRITHTHTHVPTQPRARTPLHATTHNTSTRTRCDSLRRRVHNAICASTRCVGVMKIKIRGVNGWSTDDSLEEARCLVSSLVRRECMDRQDSHCPNILSTKTTAKGHIHKKTPLTQGHPRILFFSP